MNYKTIAVDGETTRVIGLSANAVLHTGNSAVSADIDYEAVRLTLVDPTFAVDDAVQADVNGRQETMQRMQDFAAEVRATLTNNADAVTVAGWEKKAQRAARQLTGAATEADTALLAMEAQIRGRKESPDDLAKKIAAKASYLEQATMIVEAMVVNAIDRIKAASPAGELVSLVDTMQTEASAQIEKIVAIHPDDENKTDVVLDALALKKRKGKKKSSKQS